ncbi:hypothetical protein B0H15DRAFT_949949 [Mycena belliarum]|uniref:Uncharacterized protein n=1 Tax=Mycena belliarum TaxID=1033014 RepID=A0AAD6U7A9_9AGAR|nr:hypothetical protein B0H15DRAFT_949949 [Mycena belliae]
MASIVARRTSKTTVSDVELPRPLIVLLSDTDITAPTLPELLAHTDIQHPITNDTTLRHKSPIRRATSSPLTSDDEGSVHREHLSSAAGVSTMKIPRPASAQLKSLDKIINVGSDVLKDMKSAAEMLAKEHLNLKEPLKKQAPPALKVVKESMHKQYPVLLNYEHSWALDHILTSTLKNAKAKLKQTRADEKLAKLSAAMSED